MVTIKINGQEVKVLKNMTICQAAESAGHIIPAFCYDERFETEESDLRKSHDNIEVKKLYEDFLGKPGGHKSHHLLHTHYKSRKK